MPFTFTSLYELIKGRPFVCGELAFQVFRPLAIASIEAHEKHRKPLLADYIGGAAQVVGYCTKLIMKAQFVTPAKALQMNMFDNCFRYLTEEKIHDIAQVYTACLERLNKLQSNDYDAAPYTHINWIRSIETVGTAHFNNKLWLPLQETLNALVSGESYWDANKPIP